MTGISEGIGKAEWSAVLEAVCDLPINATNASDVIVPYNRLRLAMIGLGGVWDDVAKRSNQERRRRTQIGQHWLIVRGEGEKTEAWSPWGTEWGAVETALRFSTRERARETRKYCLGGRIVRVTRYRVKP